jgi:hypothetical protein
MQVLLMIVRMTPELSITKSKRFIAGRYVTLGTQQCTTTVARTSPCNTSQYWKLKEFEQVL